MRWSWVGLATFVLATSLQAQSAQSTQKMLESEAEKLRAWGSDPIIVAAVKAQNARKVPLATIRALDKQWMAGKADALIKQTITGSCADHLRQFAAANASYGEIFVMDNQGANVCASEKTSDYWQGDEAKWQRAFAAGKGGVFIDRPRYDDSASRNLAQISVPVMDGGRAIGAITIGLTIH